MDGRALFAWSVDADSPFEPRARQTLFLRQVRGGVLGNLRNFPTVAVICSVPAGLALPSTYVCVVCVRRMLYAAYHGVCCVVVVMLAGRADAPKHGILPRPGQAWAARGVRKHSR